MASLGGNSLAHQADNKLFYAGLVVVLCTAIGLSRYAAVARKDGENPGFVRAVLLFCWVCFLKPHERGGKKTQQDSLESFYRAQAGIYDATRKMLLRGREDMLALVAAQLKHQAAGEEGRSSKRRVWVDVGGGTGWNIEAMGASLDVPTFFSSVYLVDFSPSLCEVARKRFARLGWDNVHVICQDARKFRLEDYEAGAAAPPDAANKGYFAQDRTASVCADVITMSYSLSMIPDYHSVIDSLASLLAPDGVFGAVDFYVQSKVDFAYRNYTGGMTNRHVSFLARAFWRAWFELDRVSLEPGRRDYLEYRFGTLLGVNARNYRLGAIPYYIWLGRPKKPFHSTSLPHEVVEQIDAAVTESPGLPASPATRLSRAVEQTAPELRSKAFQTAVANLSAQLPLPSFFYQNHHWRVYYDDQLPKHTSFNDSYIYAFTWEDARVDERLLKLGEDDVVLALTSAGDNILAYAAQSPARIHAVDLNPAQNHLLELKVAACAALGYDDFWKLFGEGRHPGFRDLLVDRLSPHLSSRAFQYWLRHEAVFTSPRGGGLYDTGGSKHGLRAFRYITQVFGCRAAVRALLAARTLNEQREVWRRRLRPALMSPLVSRFVLSQERFLWAALGVPRNQLAMVEADHAARYPAARPSRARAVWHYMVDTLDPVVEHTYVAADNPYYLVCLDGRYSRRCRPDYLEPAAHARLSRPGALDGLRIHTDEVDEVIARMAPASLTVAVVMDSMDWFDPGAAAAASQIRKLNRALAMGGRVLLRSSAVEPWYVREFEELGFAAKRHGFRAPGECIDRVNMYASCWICTKIANLPPLTPPTDTVEGLEVEDLDLPA